MSRSSDPFELLGLPRTFELDSERVRRAYLRAVAGIHPDAGGEDEAASAINEARETLADPMRRARALLGDGGAGTGGALPPGFLAEMLELRERIDEDLRAEGEGARARWRAWARQREDEHEARVAAMFRAGEQGAVPGELNRWRYVRRLMDQLDPATRAGGPD
ncbi:MAG: hypothetical protein DYG92_04930 [Leptolyngbya sp. PLA1]|nr:hypothetical protein [Leptolyngbya sp. PLA1]